MIHEAFIYADDQEFAEVLGPFLAEAVAADQGAVAITSPARVRALQEALGPDRASVAFFESEQWYARPGETLAAWRATLDGFPAAQTVRAIGEVPFAGDAATVARWTNYESLFNRAFADRAAWVVCPYDARALPEQVVVDARRTHPVVSTGAGRAPSREHFAGQELGAGLSPGLARAEVRYGDLATVAADGESIELRRAVAWSARAAGIAGEVVEDLILAIAELARASGGATVRTAAAGGEWFCEVSGTGRTSGRLPLDENGLGIVIGRLICDAVEIDHSDGYSLVRFVFGRPRAGVRQRILAASAELFARDGVRGTGVSAIIDRAGVARGSFYGHFASKNELVLAWLESAPVRWFDGLRAEVEARAATPADRLTLFFDVLGEWLAADEFRGCQTLNTAAETRYAEPSRQALAELQDEIERYLRSAANDAGLSDPDALAAQLLLLVEGAITTMVARRSIAPATAARLAADRLIASARGRSRSRA